MKEVIHPFIILFLILPVLVATVFLLKQLIQKKQKGSAGIRIVNQLSIGSKERIIQIETNGVSMLVGVTAQQISVLHVFENDAGTTEKLATTLTPSLGKTLHA